MDPNSNGNRNSVTNAEALDGAFVTGLRRAAAALGLWVAAGVDLRGDREKAVDNAPRKPGGEPYDIARKLYETGNPIIREKIGAAATRHRDRIFAQGCDSPLEDVLKEHGGKLEEILRRKNPLKEKLFDSGLGE